MIFEIEQFLKKLLQPLKPEELMIRFLGLSRTKGPSEQPGLVLIQFDGLGYEQFMHALDNKSLPFLSRLMEKEGYTVKRMYSGLPSSTPAVQGELFYGIKMCVPAFSFKDSKTGKHFKMLSPEAAAVLEKRLSESGVPLLRGGSSYGNIFTGGAEESHFCVSAAGWSRFFKKTGIYGFTISLLFNINILVDFVIGLAAELFFAVFDFLRLALTFKNPVDSMKLAPIRAMVRVLLRDIASIGAKTDIVRGLPVVHINFAGYDEQSHYRGPKSPLVHWSLLGIDRAIKQLWKTARSSHVRDYEVIIYSDHGQEETVDYGREFAWDIQTAITSVFQQMESSLTWRAMMRPHGRHWRPGIFRNNPYAEKKSKAKHSAGELHAEVEAIGPVGHVYTPVKINDAEKDLLAQGLVLSAGIPSVLYLYEGKPVARTSGGRFALPAEADAILGRDHPFFSRVAQDLAQLCSHPDSGDLIIAGYRKEGKTITFLQESGSHAGPGPNETSAFLLLPPKTARCGHKQEIDIAGLREIAFKALGEECGKMPGALRREKIPGVVRVMSYNVHGCAGRDGLVSTERIARVIAAHEPDIICLQEIKAGEQWHQAHEIAEILSMTASYHAPVRLKTGWHGNAILSKFPVKIVNKGTLPRLARSRLVEPRGAIWIEADINGKSLQVINTHLSFYVPEQLMQVRALLGKEWAGNPAFKKPALICGDFNAAVWSRACRAMGKHFKNVQQSRKGRRATYPSLFPFSTIDHIYTDKDTKASAIKSPITKLERKASDHLPIIADIVV